MELAFRQILLHESDDSDNDQCTAQRSSNKSKGEKEQKGRSNWAIRKTDTKSHSFHSPPGEMTSSKVGDEPGPSEYELDRTTRGIIGPSKFLLRHDQDYRTYRLSNRSTRSKQAMGKKDLEVPLGHGIPAVSKAVQYWGRDNHHLLSPCPPDSV